MVLVLDGFLDAGNAAARAAQHLVDLSDGARSWRPSTSTSSTTTAPAGRRCPSCATTTSPTTRRGWSSGCSATPAARRTSCSTGPSPTTAGRPSAAAVREVVERFGVTRVVGMGSVPMAVPHTRPIAITHHANNPELLTGDSPWRGELRIPSQRPGPARGAAGGVGSRRDGLRRAHPALPRPAGLPAARPRRCSSRSSSPAGSPSTSPGCAPRPRTARPRSARYLSANEEVGEVVAALEQQYDAFERAEEGGVEPARRATSRCRPARRSASSSSSSSPGSTDRTPDRPRRRARTDRCPDRRRARRPARPRAHRRQPVPRQADTLTAAPGLRRPGRGPGPGRGRPHRRPGVRRALAALVLPAARRHPGADDLRRREPPRRPLLRHPPRGGPPARPADLLPDRQLPAARRSPRTARSSLRSRRKR